jgi:DNA-binding NtrC family response regulator
MKFRVLVAECDLGCRLGLADLLSGWAYTVEQASDGIEAVLIAQAWEPHVIVAEYDLGNMSIIEVADRIARAKVHPCILVITSKGLSQEEKNDSRLYAVLDKPAESERLRQLMRVAAVDAEDSRNKESQDRASYLAAEVLFDVRFGMTIEEVERLLILTTLKHLPNKAQTAQMLGISLKTLHNKLAQYRTKKN